MWICLNNAFVSIVAPPAGEPEDLLLVRARRPGDLTRAFPGCKVKRTPGRDYLYRTLLPRQTVAQTLADHVLGIRYGNFKGSTKDNELHDAYMRVWHVMADVQPIPPYLTEPRGTARGQRRLGNGF